MIRVFLLSLVVLVLVGPTLASAVILVPVWGMIAWDKIGAPWVKRAVQMYWCDENIVTASLIILAMWAGIQIFGFGVWAFLCLTAWVWYKFPVNRSV